jgi:hypothetical protein
VVLPTVATAIELELFGLLEAVPSGGGYTGGGGRCRVGVVRVVGGGAPMDLESLGEGGLTSRWWWRWGGGG